MPEPANHSNPGGAVPENNPFPQDKRYVPRWIVQNRVLYRRHPETFYREGFSRDISSDGACICLDELLSQECKLIMALFLSDDLAVHVCGKVIWIRPFGERNLTGISFENVTGKVQELILKHAFDLQKEALSKHWFDGWDSKKT